METRCLDPRHHTFSDHTFKRRLNLLKNTMKEYCIFDTKWYEIVNAKRQHPTTKVSPLDPLQVTTLDEYYWLRRSKTDTFYGFGKLGVQYVYFSFHYDDLKESSKLKLTYASTREDLVQFGMSHHAYERYIKDTAPM